MPRRLRIVLALLVALALAACQRQPPGPTTAGAAAAPGGDAGVRQAIEATNRDTSEAVARGDAAAVAAHYSSEAVMLPAGDNFVAGPEPIRGYFQRAMDAGMKGLTLETTSLDTAGDLAVETGTYEATGADGAYLDRGKYVMVWRREGGQWKVYRDISTTSIPLSVSPPETSAPPAGTTTPARADSAG